MPRPLTQTTGRRKAAVARVRLRPFQEATEAAAPAEAEAPASPAAPAPSSGTSRPPPTAWS
jgi:hypothetical protein